MTPLHSCTRVRWGAWTGQRAKARERGPGGLLRLMPAPPHSACAHTVVCWLRTADTPQTLRRTVRTFVHPLALAAPSAPAAAVAAPAAASAAAILIVAAPAAAAAAAAFDRVDRPLDAVQHLPGQEAGGQ